MTKRFLLVALIALVAGCISTAPEVRVTVAGGQRLTFDMSSGSAVGESSNEVKITSASLLADPVGKEGRYLFGANFLTDQPVKSILVEDVNSSKARVLLDDQQPKVVARKWSMSSASMKGNDPQLAWAMEIDESFRAYRFTFVFADGHKVVLHHASYYPPFIKTKIRKDLGARD